MIEFISVVKPLRCEKLVLTYSAPRTPLVSAAAYWQRGETKLLQKLRIVYVMALTQGLLFMDSVWNLSDREMNLNDSIDVAII